MGKTRILIVNDAVVVRRLVSGFLAEDPSLEVTGTAANGRIALAKVNQLHPDLVLLDVEMPEMDGLETLAALRKAHPQLPVIMLSRFTSKGSTTTRNALALGATDCVALPEESGNPEEAIRELQEQLLRTVKRYCRPAVGGHGEMGKKSAPCPRARVFTDPFARAPGRVDVVAIGASTGGPNALAQLLGALGPDFRVPLVIVQHIPATFTHLLAKRLSAQCAIPVVEAQHGDTLIPGKAWLAPGDFHMALMRQGATVQIRTHQEPPENSCRPSVDVLLRSAAETFGASVLAVVLTGMGKDGLGGCEVIREKGGQILVQDEASSVVWGMPGNVARAGLADQVLPLDQIGSEITRRVRPRSFSGSGIRQHEVR